MEHTKGELKVAPKLPNSGTKHPRYTVGILLGYCADTLFHTAGYNDLANANHLVLCWNSHDALLAACEAVKLRIPFIGWPTEPMNEGVPDWSKECALLEKAITLAKDRKWQ